MARKPIRYAWDRLWQDRAFDWKRGTDTRAGRGHGNGNQPAFTSEVRFWHDWLFRHIGPAQWAWFTFVDIGAGKGKVLLTWEEANSIEQELFGIESDRYVAGAAIRNLTRRNSKAIISTTDAERFRFDLLDKKIIAWFCNPFGERVMLRVLPNLEACKEVWLLYQNPKHAELMLERGWRLACLRVGYHERNTMAVLHWKP